LPIDLDFTLDLIALVIGDDLQFVGLELLIHHQAIGGKSAEVGRDGVGGVGLGQFALDRQAERNHRGNRSLARIGIDQGTGKLAEAVRGEDSAAAGTGPSIRNLTRAGAGLGAISGTSNTNLQC